jgi:hypothetical protein
MIYKRHLFTFGPTGGLFSDDSSERDEKIMGMGQDEQWEALSNDGSNARTWWRKWLKIK